MWSLGCVIAELFLGWPLYPGASEYDQVGLNDEGICSKTLFSVWKISWISISFRAWPLHATTNCHCSLNLVLFFFLLSFSFYFLPP